MLLLFCFFYFLNLGLWISARALLFCFRSKIGMQFISRWPVWPRFDFVQLFVFSGPSLLGICLQSSMIPQWQPKTSTTTTTTTIQTTRSQKCADPIKIKEKINIAIVSGERINITINPFDKTKIKHHL